jgi:hypothetical protein
MGILVQELRMLLLACTASNRFTELNSHKCGQMMIYMIISVVPYVKHNNNKTSAKQSGSSDWGPIKRETKQGCGLAYPLFYLQIRKENIIKWQREGKYNPSL